MTEKIADGSDLPVNDRYPFLTRRIAFGEMVPRVIDEHFAYQLALLVRYVQDAPPEERAARTREALEAVGPYSQEFANLCAASVSAVLRGPAGPAILRSMIERGFVPRNREHERAILAMLVHFVSHIVAENIAIQVGRKADPAEGIRLVDNAVEDVWGRHPDFWRGARQNVHLLVSDLYPEVLSDVVERRLPAERSDYDQAAVDAFANGLANIWSRIHGAPPASGLGPTLDQRIEGERVSAAREAHHRRRNRVGAHMTRSEDREARRLRQHGVSSPLVSDVPDPAEAIAASDSLACLSDRERYALHRFHVDGVTKVAIGAELNISDVAAGKLIERAKRKLVQRRRLSSR